jgi:hypothetical protein
LTSKTVYSKKLYSLLKKGSNFGDPSFIKITKSSALEFNDNVITDISFQRYKLIKIETSVTAKIKNLSIITVDVADESLLFTTDGNPTFTLDTISVTDSLFSSHSDRYAGMIYHG